MDVKSAQWRARRLHPAWVKASANISMRTVLVVAQALLLQRLADGTA